MLTFHTLLLVEILDLISEILLEIVSLSQVSYDRIPCLSNKHQTITMLTLELLSLELTLENNVDSFENM